MTAKRRRTMPIDVEPTPNGHVVVDRGLAHMVSDTDRDRAVAAGVTVYRAHFASCPNYRRTPR